MTILKDLCPLSPSGFFEIRAKIFRSGRKNFLPNMSEIFSEENFADVSLMWSFEGLSMGLRVKKLPEEGDFLEVFVDTRDIKTANSIHQFCHHFIFYPEEVDGIQGLEVTRFRGEDKHPHANPLQFLTDVTVKKRSYEMEIGMPKEVLHGYNPEEFKRIGFCYRVVRKNGNPQHFGLSSKFFDIEKHPGLWPSIELKD